MECFTVLVQDAGGSTLVSWHPSNDRVYICDDRVRLRDALVAIDALAAYVREWVEVEQLPRNRLGVNIPQETREVESSPVVDSAV